MKKYEYFGIYDFEDFAEELNEQELLFVNGGSCGGGCGGSFSPTSTPTGPTSPSTPTSPVQGQCGGFTPVSQNEQSGNGYPKINENLNQLQREMYSTDTTVDESINGSDYTALINYRGNLNKFDVGFMTDSDLSITGTVYIIEMRDGKSVITEKTVSSDGAVSGMGFDFSTKDYQNLIGIVFEYDVSDGVSDKKGVVSWEK